MMMLERVVELAGITPTTTYPTSRKDRSIERAVG